MTEGRGRARDAARPVGARKQDRMSAFALKGLSENARHKVDAINSAREREGRKPMSLKKRRSPAAHLRLAPPIPEEERKKMRALAEAWVA